MAGRHDPFETLDREDEDTDPPENDVRHAIAGEIVPVEAWIWRCWHDAAGARVSQEVDAEFDLIIFGADQDRDVTGPEEAAGRGDPGHTEAVAGQGAQAGVDIVVVDDRKNEFHAVDLSTGNWV